LEEDEGDDDVVVVVSGGLRAAGGTGETIISRHSIAGGPGLSTRCCRCCSWGVDPAAGFVCFAGAV